MPISATWSRQTNVIQNGGVVFNKPVALTEAKWQFSEMGFGEMGRHQRLP
jgi:hypothetical protein